MTNHSNISHAKLVMALTKCLSNIVPGYGNKRQELGNITPSPRNLDSIPDFITPSLFLRVPGIVQESW